MRSPEHDFSRSPDRFGGDFSRNVSLGPGAYDVSASKEQVLSNNPSSVTHSFSRQERDYPKTVSDAPGPGYYRIPVKFGEEHLYAMPVVNPDFKYV
jgi:Sperm-tail PG-rich repeat